MSNPIKIMFRKMLIELKNELNNRYDSTDSTRTRKGIYLKSNEVEKIVNDFLKEQNFSREDYRDYFESYCLQLTPDEIPGFEICSDNPSIGNFICEIQKHVIKIQLIKTFKEHIPVIQTPIRNIINRN